jgi:hypothetical protein
VLVSSGAPVGVIANSRFGAFDEGQRACVGTIR